MIGMVDTTAILSVLMPALLGGGLVTALVSLYRARTHVPVERDNIIVEGATGAVLSLEKSLRAETARADRAEAEAARLRVEVNEMAEKIEVAQRTILGLQRTLNDMRIQLARLTAEGDGG